MSNTYLTEQEVKDIILLYASGKHTQKALARKFMVDRTQVSRIVNRISRVGVFVGKKIAKRRKHDNTNSKASR